MTGPDETVRHIRKIAVAFDPMCTAPALLEAAADLAVSLGAELEALFVEDSDFARLSQLPFGRMFMRSGKVERLDAPALVSMRAGPAARSRAALRRLSQARSFAYTVREVHGRALADVATESTAELLVVASVHGKFGGAPCVDEDALQIAALSPRSVFLVSQLPVSTRRVVLVADDSDRGRRAASIAQRLAYRDPLGEEPDIDRIATDGQDAAALAGHIRAASPSLAIVGLGDADLVSQLFERLDGTGPSLLIVR